MLSIIKRACSDNGIYWCWTAWSNYMDHDMDMSRSKRWPTYAYLYPNRPLYSFLAKFTPECSWMLWDTALVHERLFYLLSDKNRQLIQNQMNVWTLQDNQIWCTSIMQICLYYPNLLIQKKHSYSTQFNESFECGYVHGCF